MAEKGASPHDRTQFLGSGSITQLMQRLSLPAVGSMVSIAIYMLIDAAFIGLLGTAELGAASVAYGLCGTPSPRDKLSTLYVIGRPRPKYWDSPGLPSE